MTGRAHRHICAGILVLIAGTLLLCPPAAAGMAQYRIHSNVDYAQVYFDNVYKGQISGGVLTVSISTTDTRYSTVEVRKAGYYTTPQSLPYISDGSSTDLYFTLNEESSKTTATLAVQTSPSGASVYINGIYQGISPPVTVTGIRPGTHTVIAEMPGSESTTEIVTITGSEYRTVTLNLGGTGTITFISDPSGAFIELDRTIIGTTPYTTTDVTPGEHQIVIMKNGYYNWRETIDMTGGNTRSIYATLRSATQNNAIRISSVPAGAAIYLNDIYQGKTIKNGYFPPLTDLRTGQHTLLLRLRGYDDYQERVSLSEGKTLTVYATLKGGPDSTTPTPSPPSARTGKLAVSTSPPGAEIRIDGSIFDRMTPVTITGIPAGTHTIRLQLAGYAPAEATVTVTAGKTATLSLPLAPGEAAHSVPTESPAPPFSFR